MVRVIVGVRVQAEGQVHAHLNQVGQRTAVER